MCIRDRYLDKELIEKSNTLASCIIDSYCNATGLANKGVISADNMTGTNWSTVPVAILEMGFMSNQNYDLYITNSANPVSYTHLDVYKRQAYGNGN